METTAVQKPIYLDWSEKERQVSITPEDQDRFCTTVEEAIKACKADDRSVKFGRQFKDLLDLLASWVMEHRELLKSAFVTIRDTEILFLPVTKSKSYDREFEDKLTGLDVEIAQSPSLDLIRLSVLALPNVLKQGIQSFLNPDYSLVFSPCPPKKHTSK